MGLYLGVVDKQLRYFAADGTLVLGPEETALREQHRAEQAELQTEQARQRADQAKSQAVQERHRAERLVQQLRDLGVDVNG